LYVWDCMKKAQNGSKRTQRFPIQIKCGNAIVRIYRVSHPNTKSGFVYSVAWYDAQGARRQKQFTKLDRAKSEAKLKAEQLQAGETEIADAGLADIKELHAARRLAGEIGLIPALEEWLRGRELCQGSIIQACEAWADRNCPRVKPITVADAVGKFLKFKQSKGVKTASSYDRTLPKLSTDLGHYQLAAISARRLEDWLEQFSHPVTANTHRKRIVTLWRWARDKGYLPQEVKTAAELTERSREEALEVGIISADTFYALLQFIKIKHPHYIAPLALAGFCGLRRTEIHGQLWEDVQLERKFVRVSAAKRGTPARRIVPLCDEAVSWLSINAQPSGEVSPGNTWAIDRIRDIGRTAGFTLPENCFRHSYVSNRVAITGDVNATSLEAGNSPRIIFQHYRELVTKEEAKAWFGQKLVLNKKADRVV